MVRSISHGNSLSNIVADISGNGFLRNTGDFAIIVDFVTGQLLVEINDDCLVLVVSVRDYRRHERGTQRKPYIIQLY
ncbi:hypothetical protein Y032_0165g51 [Ancylostoma ceylanicum]|uniref:Uncharacterized protein n=1 Tax=Ancylostoma ceylanicum TaxID=53326 RepID=A0A016SX12_9BILA|nr:hypothetical protein Y032_0165g51 [Ancylostoma ceylanicum]